MLSYQADMTLENNPFEMGMNRLINLDMEADFVGKAALKRLKEQGVTQHFVGLTFDGAPIKGSNDEKWPLERAGETVGYVTSAVYSPRLEQNIALAFIRATHSDIGTEAQMLLPDGPRACRVVPKPFYDPKKTAAKADIRASQN